MPKEIERKFLVHAERLPALGEGLPLEQGYAELERGVLRVRIGGDPAWLTLKTPVKHLTRDEFEYEIPLQDANEMLNICEKPLIEKIRYKVEDGGVVWEIDEFAGDNQGLIVAEVELQSEDQQFSRPDWVTEEVTGDPRYFNSNLIKNPYKMW